MSDVVSEKIQALLSSRLGYEVKPAADTDAFAGVFDCWPRTGAGFNFSFGPISEGFMFFAHFDLGAGAKEDRRRFEEFVAAQNRITIITKFQAEKETMFACSWFPGMFEEEPFENFLQQFLKDLDTQPEGVPPETIRFLFGDGRKPDCAP